MRCRTISLAAVECERLGERNLHATRHRLGDDTIRMSLTCCGMLSKIPIGHAYAQDRPRLGNFRQSWEQCLSHWEQYDSMSGLE
jgi:hypothetical protein